MPICGGTKNAAGVPGFQLHPSMRRTGVIPRNGARCWEWMDLGGFGRTLCCHPGPFQQAADLSPSAGAPAGADKRASKTGVANQI